MDKLDSDLRGRIDRLVSIEEIRQLAAKYALALDMRDLDALCGLFPEDIQVGKDKSGRAALKLWFNDLLRSTFTGTSHLIGNHIIEFDDPDHARGVVYCRPEHETGGEWIIMTMIYWDEYERNYGHWYFRRRLPIIWYATDLNKPPIGEHKIRWPGREPYDEVWADFWPSYKKFWSREYDPTEGAAEPAPPDKFLKQMLNGREPLSARVHLK